MNDLTNPATANLPPATSLAPTQVPQLGKVELPAAAPTKKPRGWNLKGRQKAAAQRPVAPVPAVALAPILANAKSTLIARLKIYTADKAMKQTYGLQAATEWPLVLSELTAIIDSVL